MPDQLSSDVRLDDVALPHVANPEHEARYAVPVADHGVPAEHQGLGALLWPRELREHDPNLQRKIKIVVQ